MYIQPPFYIIILNRKSIFLCFQEKSLSLKNLLKEIKIALKNNVIVSGDYFIVLFFPSAFL